MSPLLPVILLLSSELNKHQSTTDMRDGEDGEKKREAGIVIVIQIAYLYIFSFAKK